MKVSRQVIDSLLFQADIEGLLQGGAPSDEYSSEAEIIYSALAELEENEINTENIATIVSEVWKESFNLGNSELGLRQSAIKSLSQAIVSQQK